MKKESKHAEEEKLVALAKQDRKYFKPLYEKYFDTIFWFVLKRTGSEAVSGDIAQQVFFKAMINLKKYRSMGHPFSSWLYRIALNEVNQYYRKTKHRRYVEIDENQVQDLTDEIEFDEEVNPDPSKLLSKLLEVLAPDELSIIEMKYFEQKTFREIGEILSLTESATKVRAHRIMKKLRNTVNQVSAQTNT
ncbi:MAG: RNA polymerase sigma-70 factor (ECF subfamily) [Saprospiraceae bacterium]